MIQAELVEKSGVGRAWLSRVELGHFKTAKDDMLEKLAKGLEMSLTDLRREIYNIPRENNLPERNKTEAPISIPIYTEFPFHAGSPTQPVEYVHRASLKQSPKNIEGYIVHGICLLPTVQDGDIIIIDREGQIDNGDIVACSIGGELHIARLRKVAGELWLENNNGKYKFEECQVAVPVIEVIRRLK
jgi:SOS-response transcriptional repressor LexA